MLYLNVFSLQNPLKGFEEQKKMFRCPKLRKEKGRRSVQTNKYNQYDASKRKRVKKSQIVSFLYQDVRIYKKHMENVHHNKSPKTVQLLT